MNEVEKDSADLGLQFKDGDGDIISCEPCHFGVGYNATQEELDDMQRFATRAIAEFMGPPTVCDLEPGPNTVDEEMLEVNNKTESFLYNSSNGARAIDEENLDMDGKEPVQRGSMVRRLVKWMYWASFPMAWVLGIILGALLFHWSPFRCTTTTEEGLRSRCEHSRIR
jgi:hypothetical protein